MRIFSEEVLKSNFPFNGTHLIEASAGTGKTYSIQNIYARLILERGLRVSEIQVMTFTEAATKELRERLRTILADVQARLDNKGCPGKDDKERKQRNERADNLIQAGENISRERQKGFIGLALLEFDNAAISTIHGFCTRALARHAFETRMPFLQQIDDNKSTDLCRRTLDWWRKRQESTPVELLPGLDLQCLQDYVKALADKTAWDLADADESTPQGFMLLRAREIVTAYENDRQNRQTQTYDDLLRAMHEALYGSYGDVFAQELRKTFKAALIDEFQDTDPMQYDIFKKVFVEAPEIPVFFVGDPKQAIYAFRGGDIFTYLQAAKNVSQDATYYLDTNFRSTPRLMQAVNAIFKDTNGKFTFGNEYIKYSNEIKAITTDDQKIEALKISGQDDPKPFRFVEVTGNQDARLNALVQNVVETLNEQHGNLTPKDIAILVNLKATGRTIMEKLRKCGVPCVLQNPGNVFAQTLSQYKKERKSNPSRMAAELFDVLKALAKKGGEKQLRTALSTSFFGLTPVELLNLTEEQKADWMVKFDDMNHRWQSRGFAAALAKLDEYSGGYREHIVRQENGVRLLVDCEQLLELSLAAVKEIGPSPEKLIAWLEERIVHRDDESDSDVFQRELENDSDAVHILTMHKSKGLQFPVVFLPDCSLYVKDHSLHPYHRDNQLFFSIRENEAWVKEAEEELLRLLYVAMTRAKQRTVAYYASKDSGLPPAISQLIANAKANEGEDSPIRWERYEPSEELPHYKFKSDINDELKEPETPRFFDAKSSHGSYSALSPSIDKEELSDGDATGKDIDEDTADNTPNDASDHLRPIFQIRAGAEIGTCWHEILESIDFSATEEQIREVASEKLQANGFDPQTQAGDRTFLDLTVEMVTKTLNQEITAPNGKRFTLREVPRKERLSEQEFDFSSAHSAKTTTELARILYKYWHGDETKCEFLKTIANELAIGDDNQPLQIKWCRAIPKGFIKGFVDLIFRHDGYLYVFDWKSNCLKSTPESFSEKGVRQEMAIHGYFFQYLLYSAVLQRYLKDLPGFEYDWEKHYGGIRYYFLRGIHEGQPAAVFADRPCEAMLDEIGATLGMEVK